MRFVSPTFIENIFAQPKDVLSDKPTLDVQCFLASSEASMAAGLTLEATLYDGDRQLAKASQELPGWPATDRNPPFFTSTISEPSSYGT